MGDNVQQVRVSLAPDEDGFVGRECPVCESYFKVKPGTGLPVKEMNCPYCLHVEHSSKFITKEQLEYAKSVAVKQAVDPILQKFHQGLKKMEVRGKFISIRVSGRTPAMQIKHYEEKALETNVTCDNCTLQFSVYGVFANCPDCKQLNARMIFDKSLEAARKRISLSSDPQTDAALRDELLKDALISSVSAFDSLGKALRDRNPALLPQRPRNLFQNLLELEPALKTTFHKDLSAYISVDEREFLLKMFQIRHIYEHNMGVVDDDCVSKIASLSSMRGRKYLLNADELIRHIDVLQKLARQILLDFPK